MKVCEMCGAQNDDVFTKCAVCGADLPSANSQDGDDEKTVLINPDQVAEQPSGLSLKTDTSTYGQADAAQTNPQPAAPQYGGMGQPQMNGMGMNGMPQQGMPGQEDIEDMLDSYSGYDVTFKYEGVESKEMYDGDDLDDLEEDVSDYADKTIKLQDACDLEFSFNVAVTMSGETYDQSSTYPITCIKYKGNWYLYE